MLTYRDAGVNIDAGNELVQRIRSINPQIGGFSGLFPLGDQYLVASTDGVGTKLKLAFSQNRHDTIGIDLVAMSVNDVIVVGAKPLFFLDYYASSKLDVDQAEAVIRGIVAGCKQAGCVLLGGETAEMPGFYAEGEYDLSGFAVGVVAKDDLIDGSQITPGDVVLGLPSSGMHSNGFSLVRRVIEKEGINDSLAKSLLTPTKIYVHEVHRLLAEVPIKGMAHITGGGFYENIARILPDGMGCRINRSSWRIPTIFEWLQQATDLSDREAFRTFNMGIGLVGVLSPDDAEVARSQGWIPLGHINDSAEVEIC